MSTGSPTAPAAAAEAVRRATRVDHARINVRAGIIAAIPVAGMLTLGTAVNQPVAAVTMAVGAMLVGISWRAGDGPVNPPVGMMAADALVLAFATLTGTLTGRWPWLHLGVLACFCLLAGCATSLGRRGAVVGTQSIIAFVVFGRFPETVGPAFSLAGLVLLGGVTQVTVAALVGSPLAWRRQRTALGVAYRALGALAMADVGTSSIPAASALERADTTLTAPALFADRQLTTLKALVSAGRRIRLELIVLGTVVARIRRRTPDTAAGVEDELTGVRRRLAEVLSLIAETLDPDAAPASGRAESIRRLRVAAEELSSWGAARPAFEHAALEQHAAALIGQVSAAARQALLASAAADLRHRLPRPSRGQSRRALSRFRDDARRIRAAASLESPAGRHALRLAIVVAGMELLTQRLALPRGYWAVVAAATVLRPDFGGTFTRGAERMLGTSIGVVLATLIAVAIDPTGWGITAVVAVLAWITYSVFSASFAAGTAGFTAVVVFLLHAVAPDSTTIALDRGLDTLLGGTIGLAVYSLWPTWSGTSVPRLIATVLGAQRSYLAAILAGLIDGRGLQENEIAARARAARMAWTDAEAALTIARNEPHRPGIDPNANGATLAAVRRVAYAVHGLRLGEAHARSEHAIRAQPELAPLSRALLEAVATIETELDAETDGQPTALPPLRTLYRRVRWQQPDGPPEQLRVPFDELVDAINTVAASAGLELPTDH